MRLSTEEVNAIKSITRDFDSEAKMILFGSRLDDTGRGGDIDLLVLSRKASLKEKIKLLVALKSKIGERKIDLILKQKPDSAFTEMVVNTGIKL